MVPSSSLGALSSVLEAVAVKAGLVVPTATPIAGAGTIQLFASVALATL